MTLTLPSLKVPKLATIVAVLEHLGGIVGLILGALHVGQLAGPVNNIIVGLSSLLVLVGAHHASSLVVKRAAPVTNIVTPATPVGTVQSVSSVPPLA